MFERPVNGVAALIALAALVLSVQRALANGYEFYSMAATGVGVAMLLVGGWWLARQGRGHRSASWQSRRPPQPSCRSWSAGGWTNSATRPTS